MSCEAYRQHLSLMMDAEAGGVEQAGLFAHLEGCAECRHFFDSLIRFRSAARRDRDAILREAGERLPGRPPLPATAAAGARPPARAGDARGASWRDRLGDWLRPGVPAPAALALAVLLLIAGVAIGVSLSSRLGGAPPRAPEAETVRRSPAGTTFIYVCSLPEVEVSASAIPEAHH